MARRKDVERPTTRDGLMKSLLSKFHKLGRTRGIEQVFRDFCEVVAITLSNAVDKAQFAVREARYLDIYKAYASEEEKYFFPQMLAELVEICGFGLTDVFQEIWDKLEMRGNSNFGQYFTPFHVSHMMAKMTLTPPPEVIKKRGFFTMQEPACGPGGMIIAAALALQEQDLNYQKCLHVTAIDIDRLCVHMAYIQCCLYGIPAVVIRGDSLRMEMHEHWYSTLHVVGHWSSRLQLAEAIDAFRELDKSFDVNAAWSQTSTSERIRLMTEAGIEDLSLVLGDRMPEGVVLPQAAE